MRTGRIIGALSIVVGIRDNLQFPDGITVVDSSRFDVDFNALSNAPKYTPANCSGE
jgi:hypothetical protein